MLRSFDLEDKIVLHRVTICQWEGKLIEVIRIEIFVIGLFTKLCFIEVHKCVKYFENGKSHGIN